MKPESRVATTSRRRFLRGTAATTAGVLASGALPYHAWNQPAFANTSANDRPQLGWIGLGGQGRGVAKGHAHFGDIVALADVDLRNARLAQSTEELKAAKADIYQDYRRVLERPDVDVVCIATPDHWHVKIAIEAMQAGKHVFCEKPLTLTLEENQIIRRACERHPGSVFSVGTWQRSQKNLFVRAVNLVQKGLLGKIKKVHIGIDGSPTGGPFPIADAPAELDWDMWLGQAPEVAYREKRCHYQFRWWYEYSGGKFTDWGAHHIDIALWALGQQEKGTGPIEFDGSDAHHPVELVDGMPAVDDRFNTSNDFEVACRFADDTQMLVSSRVDNGILFEGEKGRIFVSRKKIVGLPIEEGWDDGQFTDEDASRLAKGKPSEWATSNFFRCIREGGLTMSDPYSHVQAMNCCHLTAIAARLGRKIQWDPVAEKIVGDDVAASLFAREQRAGYEIPTV